MEGERDNSISKEIWEGGIELAANLTGLGITLAIAGGPGALAGTLALPVAKAFWRSAFSTCFGGLLGKREMIRLTALQIILQRGIERRFEGGQQLRNDDLLVEYMPGRSDAEEIAEAIMRVVQRDPEERKLRFHASLLESIAFDDSIDAQFAHHLTSYTASLSYRQLCILELVRNVARFDLYDKPLETLGRQSLSTNTEALMADIFDLKHRGLVFTGSYMDWSAFEINPASMRLEQLGERLHATMCLDQLPEWEIRSIAKLLKFKGGS